MACINYCKPDGPFLKRPNNRSALPHLAYRIGAYPDFVREMLARIDASVELGHWTHRGADDPGIALIEGAATVADILAFYQEHYGNEAFLRTAAWKESVAELVRLTGYRLAPGLGGRTTFALEFKGAAPVTVAAGLPLKAELAGVSDPVDFETAADLVAWPHLSAFRLYRPRVYHSVVSEGTRRLELLAVGGSADAVSLAAVGLKKGDKLTLKAGEKMWSTDNTTFTEQASSQTVAIAKVTQVLDRWIIELEDPVKRNWTGSIEAWRIKGSYHHFGFNAPAKYTVNDTTASKVTGAREYSTDFIRHLFENYCTAHSIYRRDNVLKLYPDAIPLEREVDLPLGADVLIETYIELTGGREAALLARTIDAVENASLSCAGIQGTSTILTFTKNLTSDTIGSSKMDIRECRVIETTSPKLLLRAASRPDEDEFSSATGSLFFFGTSAEALLLANRPLLLRRDDGVTVNLVCTSSPGELTLGAGEVDVPRRWPLNFDQKPAPLLPSDFDEETPAVTVYGNLIAATQGKTESAVPLGNGDSRQAFQTFKVPKPKVTYLWRDGATPPETPELEVRVNGRLWQRVLSLFGHGPLEEIYVCLNDLEGNTFVQFGDGETGARLPSGLNNVVARYRTGRGARGSPAPGGSPSAPKKPVGLGKVWLWSPVSGGSDDESADKARDTAPGRLQSLGRLVSLRDYETEVQQMPGVSAATAAWDLNGRVPTLKLQVLMDGGREGEFNSIRAQIETARVCHGPSGYPVDVAETYLRYLYLDLDYSYDLVLARADVEASIRAALGLVGDDANSRSGLFGLRARRIGQEEYASRIEGRVQQVSGVSWCQVKALELFDLGIDPKATPLPGAPRVLQYLLSCPSDQILQLWPTHLTLTPMAAAGGGACK